MDGQKSLEMGRSSFENLLQEDEVFHDLSPLDLRYPESSGMNIDLDSTYLLDNPSGTTIHSVMDVLPDPTVVHEGGISVGQDGEFGLQDQGLATMNSLPIPDQEIPETSFSNLLTHGINSSNVPSQETTGISFSSLLTQGINSWDVPSQEMTGMSFSDLLTQGTNPLIVPGQEMSELGSSSFLTQDINSLNFNSQEMSEMGFLSLSTLDMNSLNLHSQEMSMMDTLSIPNQETFMNTLEFPNQGLSMMDRTGIPTQDTYMNTLELPTQGASMLESLSFPTQDMMPLAFPYQTQPMTMTMEHITENEGANIVISSEYEQLQQEFDHHDGNGNGAGGSNPYPPLRQTLSREMISQYFHLSLTDAARALNVGKTLLKTRCRELNISRWPQRKFKSLQTIISQLQESGESSGSRVEENVQERIRWLEYERNRMEENPDIQLEEDTIRLRQACYKSSHRKKKQSDRDH